MADVSAESVAETSQVSEAQQTSPEGPYRRHPKLKGHKRILHSLQRISSSPSIVRLSRSSSGSYRGTGKGSISCISLSSSSYNNGLSSSHGSNISNGYSTAPTSVPSTPGIDTPGSDANSRVRFVNGDRQAARSRATSSVPVPQDVKVLTPRPATATSQLQSDQDYFSCPTSEESTRPCREDFDFWGDLPAEIRMHILTYLKPKEIVKCSAVSKAWYRMCFDGQLWQNMNTQEFYRDIPARGLVKIITQAGSFVRDLNLRGCVQLHGAWQGTGLADACRNLENLSLEGCRIDLGSIHSFLHSNPKLLHLNLTGLLHVDNTTMKKVADNCPRLEHLNVSWCRKINSKGLIAIVQGCPNLRDLRAGELSGFSDLSLMNELFKSNTLERLMITSSEDLTDESLAVLMEGLDSEIDILTGRRNVEPRKLIHLDISDNRNITDTGLRALVHNTPSLQGLRLSKCRAITDSSMILLIPTLPNLTHLDLEDLDLLTNSTLQELAKSPCRQTLQHLSISSCEQLGDSGMIPVVKSCAQLRNLDLDNTRISDLVLAEAAAMVRQRCSPAALANRARSLTWDGALPPRANAFTNASGPAKPKVGLKMVVYDCQNVTWTGIREVLSRNAEIRRPVPPSFFLPSFAPATTATSPINTSLQQPNKQPDQISEPANPTSLLSSSSQPSTGFQNQLQQRDVHSQIQTAPSHPHQIISLKVFYGYQPTVTEHTRRVLRGDLASASRLERKWAEYMMASEEAGAAMGVGTGNGLGNANAGLAGLGLMGNRRRRRRVREAQMMHADEEEGGGGLGLGFGGVGGAVGIGRRRRARSGGGCLVM